MWVSLKKILPFTINKLGIRNEMDAYDIFHFWDELIKKRYQNSLKQKITPLSFKKGLLVIGCRNSVLAGELRLQEKNILREIHQKTKSVQKIKFTMV